MIHNKLGLAGGRVDIDPEITNIDFKPYVYTTEDASRYYKKYPIACVSTNSQIKYSNGILYIDNKEYDVGDKTLQGILDLISSTGAYVVTAGNSGGSSQFNKLPGILLNNFNNVIARCIEGTQSPIEAPDFIINESLKSMSDTSTITIVDTAARKEKKYKYVNNRLFFTPSKDTLVYVTNKSTIFYLYISMAPRRLESKKAVAHYLNFKEDHNEF